MVSELCRDFRNEPGSEKLLEAEANTLHFDSATGKLHGKFFGNAIVLARLLLRPGPGGCPP